MMQSNFRLYGLSGLVGLIAAMALFVFVWDTTEPEIDTASKTPSSGNLSYAWWGPHQHLSDDVDSSGAADHRYVIPFGAGAAIEAGEAIEILPAILEVHVGETIEIVNEDDRLHFIGPFTVEQGEVLRQRFSKPGESLQTLCSIHLLGSVQVIVSEV